MQSFACLGREAFAPFPGHCNIDASVQPLCDPRASREPTGKALFPSLGAVFDRYGPFKKVCQLSIRDARGRSHLADIKPIRRSLELLVRSPETRALLVDFGDPWSAPLPQSLSPVDAPGILGKHTLSTGSHHDVESMARKLEGYSQGVAQLAPVVWRLWYVLRRAQLERVLTCAVFGLMGAARGIDEGLIGTTAELEPFRRKFGLDDPSKSDHEQAELLSNITSMVQMGSILGALIAFFLTDKIGRLWATRQLCLLWVLGITIFLASAATSGNVGMIYAGRFIAGIGIGQTTVVAPTYLAETAPRAIRGLCVCAFAGAVYIGIMLAYFASWGSSIHISSETDAQWLVPNSMHLMFAGIIFTLSFLSRESPRWLIKVGRHEEALENLCLLRQLPADHPYVQSEIIDINSTVNARLQWVLAGSVRSGSSSAAKRTYTVSSSA
jgi:MFS family permease